MKKVYLILTILGLIAPSILVAIESYETGNILLYADPVATFTDMFANRISSIFAIDLLFAVIVFMIWSYVESKKHSIPRVWAVWLVTFAFGFAGGLPLFLYLKARKQEVES